MSEQFNPRGWPPGCLSHTLSTSGCRHEWWPLQDILLIALKHCLRKQVPDLTLLVYILIKKASALYYYLLVHLFHIISNFLLHRFERSTCFALPFLPFFSCSTSILFTFSCTTFSVIHFPFSSCDFVLSFSVPFPFHVLQPLLLAALSYSPSDL